MAAESGGSPSRVFRTVVSISSGLLTQQEDALGPLLLDGAGGGELGDLTSWGRRHHSFSPSVTGLR